MNNTQTATITIDSDTRAGGNVLSAGTYQVQMPADYDPAAVTGEDVLMDDAITVLDDDGDADTCDCCGGQIPAETSPVYDRTVNDEGTCTGALAVDSDGRVLGCGAFVWEQ